MPPKIFDTILVDQDGVLAAFASFNRIVMNDYLSNTLGLKGKPVSQEDMIEKSRYDIAELWDVERDLWWDVICDHPTFWKDIPMFPWAPELVRKLRDICERLVVSTNPGADHDPRSASQKIEWFAQREHLLGFRGCDLMIGTKKALMARPGTLLIDDAKHNVEKFIAEGGEAVLVPSDWNCRHHGLHAVWSAITEYIDEKKN